MRAPVKGFSLRNLRSVLLVAFGLCLSPALSSSESSAGEFTYSSKTRTWSRTKSNPRAEMQALAMTNSGRSTLQPASVYPIPRLGVVNLSTDRFGDVSLGSLPQFGTQLQDKYASLTKKNQYVFYSMDSRLQRATEQLVNKIRSPHLAVVMMDPRTGRILSIAGKSGPIRNITLHSGFPAASLFKVVTSAAALERSTLGALSKIKFRGGDYTLNKYNYLPDKRRDTRTMSLAEALGKSCNPVFGRVALQHLNSDILKSYSRGFGFNTDLRFNPQLPKSGAHIPSDGYGLSRTAAGFGNVTMSPVHAAAMMSAVANGGQLPRPYLIDKVVSGEGAVQFQARPEMIQRAVQPTTSRALLQMMEYTTTVGTSKGEFMSRKGRVLPMSVAAKTGTLRGRNPVGLNRWFIAAAPSNKPEVAIAVIAVNPMDQNARPSRIGRQLLQEYFKGEAQK